MLFMIILKVKLMYIERLNNIDSIIDLQNKFYKEHHIFPYNVSNWTVSNEFRNTMEQVFHLENDISPIDYLYSYNISRETREKIMLKLGLKENIVPYKTCVFFPNNSLSIVNVCNLLQKKAMKKVGIINPAYFSIAACLDTCKINHKSLSVKRINQEYIFPLEEVLAEKFDAVWITSPIYSTGTCYSETEINKIKVLLETGILVIADESFCIQGKELVRFFAKYDNFIGIYSPHKALSINSYKFSVIVADIETEDFFEQWLDIFCGNLPQATIAAIYHYLSDNFEECHDAFEFFISNSLNVLSDILHKFDNVSTDNIIYGNMMTVYIAGLDYNSTQQLNFIQKVIECTHTLYYPGSLNGFSDDFGMCFRINLALYSPQFLSALQRLLIFLSNI